MAQHKVFIFSKLPHELIRVIKSFTNIDLIVSKIDKKKYNFRLEKNNHTETKYYEIKHMMYNSLYITNDYQYITYNSGFWYLTTHFKDGKNIHQPKIFPKKEQQYEMIKFYAYCPIEERVCNQYEYIRVDNYDDYDKYNDYEYESEADYELEDFIENIRKLNDIKYETAIKKLDKYIDELLFSSSNELLDDYETKIKVFERNHKLMLMLELHNLKRQKEAKETLIPITYLPCDDWEDIIDAKPVYTMEQKKILINILNNYQQSVNFTKNKYDVKYNEKINEITIKHQSNILKNRLSIQKLRENEISKIKKNLEISFDEINRLYYHSKNKIYMECIGFSDDFKF
jgi:hypothetical protein